MPLTEKERTRVMRHLGYTVLSTPTTLSLGYPEITQANFIAGQNLLNLTAAGEALVLEQLEKLDCFEKKLTDLTLNPEVVATGQVRFDVEKAIEIVEGQYRRHQQQLADMVGCPINPLSIKDRPRGVVEPC